MKHKESRGFTLIELLVVIAIIGILAGTVLVSLGSARNKGKDGVIKEQLHSVRNAAELHASSKSGGDPYNGFCLSPGMADITTKITKDSGAPLLCDDTTKKRSYAVQSELITKASDGVTTQYWCVDSSGYAGLSTGASFDVTSDTTKVQCAHN